MNVHYEVTLDPTSHELGVELAIDGVPSGQLVLATPTWVPGAYEFAPFARDLFDVRATDASTGAALTVRRHGWSAYAIDVPARGAADRAVTVRYRAAAASVAMSEACGVLGDQHGVLLGTRYLRVTAHDGRCTVRYHVPDGWAIHHPSGATRLSPQSWEYDSYARLLDTPVSFGAFDRITREVRGTPFHHVFLTRALGFEANVEGFVEDLCEIAAVYHDIFGAFPFDDYTFVLSFNPNDAWGLEHLTSTMAGLDPATFHDSDQYNVSLRVCAHELFHAWNVRRLRPAPLGRFDFERGGFSEGLWVAEGFTRYYEFLSCTRTAVYTPAQFISAVTGYYTHLAALPAWRHVSPADASAAAYLNHDKYPGRANSAIDYYDAGMVIAFELDAILRLETGGAQSLDTVFAAFYDTFAGKGVGYTIDDVCEFFERYRPGLGNCLRTKVVEPAKLALPERLRALGFDVSEGEVPYCGLLLADDTGPAVYSVLDGSPASRSGLAAEDVIVAVDSYPFSLEALNGAVRQGADTTLDVLRGNQRRRYTIQPGERSTLVSLRWAGNARQAALISQWLKQPFAPTAGQPFPLDFYENFHGIETVI
ncbi:M61 family metallopeptidase [Paraburkholderia caballeronis]|uniref:Predicted metalloprotease, contains C-terminal PDZ domain n=1 Tax=Paraburkholderia caballeronis TaxID=416943 RepID=A0A1H7M2J0_9BURK|nr:PDZ domain-containing protein [Paraburkholderia caballeronis]PXW28697.1 putative metalloprotease with PDZ domain [Paraburkholderia caballeronis]PXX04063.1 putative metalloprotease with PDZ domain [Paraburkholderia caballeronis]RAK04807.1 putative metalloprotease with PDZ domain [Paraburkholderia caballeronis]SED63862.1 Predicted metalloprotease, contains C-terminal PDZ domain [Paraburkholderia caballeronis]SEL05371.1 Predicted metalloprotease, contains C-terminal PDZ domain [Paraburkholderi